MSPDTVEEKSLCLHRESNTDYLIIQPVISAMYRLGYPVHAIMYERIQNGNKINTLTNEGRKMKMTKRRSERK